MMKFLKLECDNINFKTIIFNPGLNIVAGIQLSKKQKSTYNGVGKSLSLQLLQYILGAKLEDKKVKAQLKDYGTFTLTFEINGKPNCVIKDFSKTEFNLNGEVLGPKDFTAELTNLFSFSDFEVSFRQVFNTFARRYGGSYYTNALSQQGQPIANYHQRFVNFKMLGIETDLVKKKCEIKEKIKKIDDASKLVSEYESELDKSNIPDLKDELLKLRTLKANFKVAENYDNVKNKADELTEEMNIIRDEIYENENKIKRHLENIKLSESVNVDTEQVINIYNEANFFFGEKIKKRLEEAQSFHIELISNRKERLEKEISILKSRIDDNNKILDTMSVERDSLLKDLDNTGALEEFNSISNRITTLEDKIKELTKYKEVLRDFKKEKTGLNTDNSQVREKSLEYIEESTPIIEKKEKVFRDLVKRFYETTGGSLSLVDTKDAKYLYNIDIHVPKEGSQGVGEVKIFCYDILLYLLNKDLINFIAHDGCIFSEMDPRQKSMIFKIVLELINEHDLQYFVNINQNSLKEILNSSILSNDDKNIINDSIVLKLLDLNPKNWLLGESFG